MNRLDVNDPKVFDRWRELYYDLTHEENIEFGNAMEAKYPGQASFNKDAFLSVLKTLPNSSKILEVGGWKGELAQALFHEASPKIYSWKNIDMCRAAVMKTVVSPSLPYTPVFPARFDWFRQPREEHFDACFSAHTIEHLTGLNVIQLIDWLKGIPTIVFEAPISYEGQTWEGYEGTHILEFGWLRINAYMAGSGYSVEKLNDWCFRYERLP